MNIREIGLILSLGIFNSGALLAEKADDSLQAGIPVINNPKSLALPDGRQRHLLFKEDLSIGVKEGEENYMFGERVELNVDAAGNIYVVDWDRKRIQKYDSSGRYLLTIGRKGQGPGEFVNVWRPEFDQEGNLYVVDIRQKRISFFSPSGKFLRQLTFPRVQIDGQAYFTADRNIITSLTNLQKRDAGDSKWEAVIGLYDPQFRLLAEFGRTSGGSKPLSGTGEDAIARSWGELFTDMAFRPSPSYAPAPNGEIYYGLPDRYEITVYAASGQAVRIIRKEDDPIPVTERDKDAFRETMKTEFLTSMPGQLESAKNKALRLIRFPKFKPAYKGFILDDQGRLIVIVEDRGGTSAVLDVFDAGGRGIGRSLADIPVEGLRINKDKAYAVATVEGYHFIKRYAIEETIR